MDIEREQPNDIRENAQTQGRMFARPLAKAGQISVGFFGKGSVSLRGNGGCSAGNRRGLNKKRYPNEIRGNEHRQGTPE